ncbi:DNA repair protein RecN [Clostridium sp. YIM B02505]|uniref:DNA repair protein RecN n=1 Tax=Clostridium yunnanense TaxID=2800325 RepID=A0ABS1ENH2_9CLOT|nr:DNA repair protein RecN [Clostridium yunnanense]MBK1810983.1 DNA repair protein RecN [Clostridium yunnanense]
MLLQLTIENFALIEKICLSFDKGFNILSGETGAGKSIIIDAINYVLGGKFNKDIIRTGENKTFVEAIFDIESTRTKNALEELEIETDDLIIISRESFQNGKSVIKVNGKSLIISSLKRLTETLVDIHGQHENQNLMNKSSHINYLDSFGEESISETLTEYRKLFSEVSVIEEKIRELRGNEDNEKLANYIKYQIDDIDEGKLKPEEEAELNEKLAILSNAEKISKVLSHTYNDLRGGSEDGSIIDKLSRICYDLSSITKYSEKIKKSYEELNEIFYNLQEISNEFRDISDEYVFDDDELDRVNRRTYEIGLYKKKYGETIEAILDYRMQLEEQYNQIVNSEQIISSLIDEKNKIYQQMRTLSENLHNQRIIIGKDLEERISSELRYVGLEKSKFSIDITSVEEFNIHGMDKVLFLISTNPGEPLKSLEKVVSGGELSRIMLSLKTVFVNKDKIPTVIFDEIDTGISGRIAQAVGEKMYEVSVRHQVFCITHLPQIASMSDNHFLISKHVDGEKTYTKVKIMNSDEKDLEVAKMIGGAEVTSATLVNAKEMVELANIKKNKMKSNT